MKLLTKCACCALFILGISMQVAAQMPASGTPASTHSNALLFADLPDSVLLEAAVLQALLQQELNAPAQVRLAPSFSLQGKVVSTARNTGQRWSSVVLKASNRLGAVFTLSSITDNNGTTHFTGRILSRAHGDAFELVQDGGRYYLVKREHSDLVEE